MPITEATAQAALVDPNTGKDFVVTRPERSVKVSGDAVTLENEPDYPGKSQFETFRREAIDALKATGASGATVGGMAPANAVRGFAGQHHAVLLANHGPVVAGSTHAAAADAVEELEATAKLYLPPRHEKPRCLSPDQVARLRRKRAT